MADLKSDGKLISAIEYCYVQTEKLDRFRILSSNGERDLLLKARYLSGETLSTLAREFGLTPQRVFQIIRNRH